MKEKLIDGVLENFDFDKVKKTMDFLNWIWVTTPEHDSVPSTYQIMKGARERLEEAYENAMKSKKDGYSFCGGLKASAEYNEELKDVDFLQLDFIVTTWDEQI